MSYTPADVKKLREQTGAGIMDCKKALEEAEGDFKKATQLVKARGLERAEKKQDRETTEGYVASYVHSNGKLAAMVELVCETDFVARNEEFRSLGQDIAMQVVSMQPENVDELLDQEFIKDGGATIGYLIKSLSGKIGEKIAVKRFVRYQVGE
ncbi:MAG: translation elongation factor Ts [Candidatus Pacebacteria bacterium]|nr:translation elongation factor Ts [Candidatus Paceibacterota bacterium]PIR60050.1 MAG: translation elongation factor Ts [Candidatus Pacebacteria bacterium CG10_big_fil_rev_8_21_14_0_10_44_54]